MQIIFKHIPRTGGNSFREALPEGMLFLGHDFYDLMYKHLHYHVKDLHRPFVFAFVRNPYDRVVSAFHYLTRGGNNPLDEHDRVKYIEKYSGDFDAFVRNAFPEILLQIHFMEQWKWIYWGDTPLCNEVGRFEDLSQYAIPHLNKSKRRRSYEEYYTPETKEIIYKYYEKDFRLFGYDK